MGNNLHDGHGRLGLVCKTQKSKCAYIKNRLQDRSFRIRTSLKEYSGILHITKITFWKKNQNAIPYSKSINNSKT